MSLKVYNSLTRKKEVFEAINPPYVGMYVCGQIARKTVDIENYPGFEKISGMDLIQNLEKHLRRFAINIETDSVIKVEKKDNFFSVLTERKSNFQTKAIIIASGVGSRLLRIPGEEEFIGRGVSFCSVCDGPLFSNKIVAIIGGGGPAGMTAGIYAARQKLNTLLITKTFGGQIARKTVDIENYPGFEKIS